MDALRKQPNAADDEAVRRSASEEQHLWKVRESGLGATAHVPGRRRSHGKAGRTRRCRPISVGDYLRDLRQLLRQVRLRVRALRPFRPGLHPHAASTSISTPPRASRIAAFMDEAADSWSRTAARSRASTATASRGRELLPKMFGAGARRGVPRVQGDLGSRREDEPRQGRRSVPHRREPAPRRRLPPAASRRRISSSRRPRQLRATRPMRCVGVGECRRARGRRRCARATCHARGDALHARPGAAALRNAARRSADGRLEGRAVKEALDLCLACKGCKSDCPVNVDMATYKAEFLSHYYEGPPAAAHRVRDGLHPPLGAAGVAPAAARQPGRADARPVDARQSGRLASHNTRGLPAIRRRTFVDWFRAAPTPAHQRPTPRGSALAGHLQQSFPSGHRDRGDRSARSARLSRSCVPRRRCAAAGRSTTTAFSTRRSGCCDRSWTRCDRTSTPARRSSSSSRAATRYSATSW